MGEVIYLHPANEPWVSKKQLSFLISKTPRYIEYRMQEGMPSRLVGGQRQFRVSAVECWLRDNGHLEDQ